MVSVFVPILYLAVLIGGLGTFSYFYRRRQPAAVSQLEAWFPPNVPRDIYFSLQAQEDVPTGLLKSALLLRAVEDIKRLQTIQVRKNALNTLMQKGGAGEDLWTRFLQLEEEMKGEVMDVASEAQALQEGWNQIIFQTANEMFLNDGSRQTLSKIVPMAQQLKQEYNETKDLRDRAQLRAKINRDLRTSREKKEAEARQRKEEEEAEAQRERAIQELIAMEASSKTSSGTSSPKNKKKK